MIPNTYTSNGNGTTSLIITRRNGQTFSFLIDDESVPLIHRYQWSINARYEGLVYALTSERVDGKRCNFSLHRIITNAPEGLNVDHVSGDTLDNRLCNLRFATHAQNIQNSRCPRHNKTGFKGVHYHRTSGWYRAEIDFEGHTHSLGQYATPQEAADAYDKAAIRLYGKFARPNSSFSVQMTLFG